jgi:hypothetical protein
MKRWSWSRSKSSTARSIRPCGGAHVLGGDQPVIGADAVIHSPPRHPRGEGVGDEHAVEEIGGERITTAFNEIAT